MKKFAYILMGKSYDMEKHRAEFSTGEITTYIYTVNTFEDAEKLVLKLEKDGFGVVELCGAFGKEKANRLIELTSNQLGVGHVVNNGEQSELFQKFFERDDSFEKKIDA